MKKLITILFSFSTLLSVCANEMPIFNDGPYVTLTEDFYKLEWICKGKAKSLNVKQLKEPLIFSECGLQAKVFPQQLKPDLLKYQGNFKIAALSDVHGQYELMLDLLRNNQIINDNNKWRFSDGHLVITGDMFDRGDKVTEVAWFLYELERQALAAGGKVHLLLGNHEVMVMNGNLKYLHSKYQRSAALLSRPFADFFRENTVLGDWLRSKNIAVKINDSLFVHGGFHPGLASAKLNLSIINQIFKEYLVEDELESPRIGIARYLHESDGPIWYRGYLSEHSISEIEIDKLINHFEVKRIVVGHTSQTIIGTRYQGKVVAIDASIKKGRYGEVLFIQGSKIWRGSLSGEVMLLK